MTPLNSAACPAVSSGAASEAAIARSRSSSLLCTALLTVFAARPILHPTECACGLGGLQICTTVEPSTHALPTLQQLAQWRLPEEASGPK